MLSKVSQDNEIKRLLLWAESEERHMETAELRNKQRVSDG